MFEAPLAAVLRTRLGPMALDRTAAKRYLGEMRSTGGARLGIHGARRWGQMARFLHAVRSALEVRRGETWVSWSFPHPS